MEDEERQKKVEAGKAKLAEYRQRKAHADSQKKQKKKKKKKPGEGDVEGDSQGRLEAEHTMGEEGGVPEGGGHGLEEGGEGEPPTTEFTFARTLRTGETVRHDQTYTIEPESEVSTTAEDYSSEVNGRHEMTENPMESSEDLFWEEAEALQRVAKGGRADDMEDDELGVQQLQDFEAALKQRDGIITQLTANLQEARQEKDDIMREFLEMTEQSRKLHIQFQQLQAGETLRNTSHSSTAADLLQARQQLAQHQQQLEDMSAQVRGHQERSNEQMLHISQLQHKVNELEMAGRRSEESFAQTLNEKHLLIAEQEKIMLGHEQSLMQIRSELSESNREAQASFAQTLSEKDLLISEQTAIITEHERSLSLLKEELAQFGRNTQETFGNELGEKDRIILQQEKVISERDCSLTQLEDEVESFKNRLNDVNQRMASKETELEKCLDELDSCKVELETCKGELESCTVGLEKERTELESCKAELTASRQKERMSSNEIMQLMGTVEDLQKRFHQGSLSDSENLKKVEEESVRKLDLLRAELDEMYGEQIVCMKRELNLQHTAEVDRMLEQHRAEIELLKAQQASQSEAVNTSMVNELSDKIRDLEEMLQEAQVMQTKTKVELNQVSEEKLHLQAQVENLLQDIRSAKAKQASENLASQESQQEELQRLQETIDNLKSQLLAAEEAAEEAEAKHESETTNYKIKLEMLEREKDAVLDRMAESQEAELDRLRTQLLFSHEEELTHLREDLQRESFLNAENLLNEASIKHGRALEELRISCEDQLRLLRQENAGFSTERDELLHQILALKEDLNLALDSSKADDLVQQLQELQVEVEDLRRGAEERARLEKEIQVLLKKTDTLESEAKEKQDSWDNKWKAQQTEKEDVVESNKALTMELESQSKRMELVSAENNQMQQQVVELREEIEKQRTTFSFAEKNFEVNYQELKDEYTCLIQVKTQLEERILRETLDFEAKVANLQAQVQELEECNKKETGETGVEGRAQIEKDTTELMEKLEALSSEKQSLSTRLSEVTDQMTSTKGRLEKLEVELRDARLENKKVTTQNERLEKELEREREITREQKKRHDAQSKGKLKRGDSAAEDHHLQIESLQGEVAALRASLQAAEAERDRIRHTLEVQRQTQTQTPSPAAVPSASPGEGSVDGRTTPQKPTASGSSRRKKRQKSKHERQSSTAQLESREERKRGGEEEEEQLVLEEESATSVAEPEVQARMESHVTQRSQQRTRDKDSTDGYQGDGGAEYIKDQERSGDGAQRRRRMEPVERLGGVEDGGGTPPPPPHAECRLELEAQRISLFQIHAAQMELLQEQADARIQSLQLELDGLREQRDPDLRELKAVPSRELKADVQLEKAHRQEMERVKAYYQQQAREMEQCHRMELSVLQQRLQEATGSPPQPSLSAVPQWSLEALEEQAEELKLVEEEVSEVSLGAELHWPVQSMGLTARLQTLRKALYRKYVQEVTALKDQHRAELQRLTQERGRATEPQGEGEGAVASGEQDPAGINGDERFLRGPGAGGYDALEKPQRKIVEEEIAKVIVQMSVEFAQQSELARINKRARETTSSMQTQEEDEEQEKEQQTPKASAYQDSSLEELEASFHQERERWERELREKTAELQVLKERLLKPSPEPEQALRRKGEEERRARRGGGGGGEEDQEWPSVATSEERRDSSHPDVLTTERNLLRKANESLRQVLIDVLKTTAAAEETIGLHVSLLESSGRSQQPAADRPSTQRTAWHRGAPRPAGESGQGSDGGADEDSLWSRGTETDEGMELSQQVADSLLLEPEMQLENEEYLANVSGRLHTAVEKLLRAITETNSQLEHARVTQTELMRESFRHNQEMGELLQRQEELQERLSEEERAREQLALELHRAEGLIDGYTGERAALEESIRQKEELHLSLEQELEVTSSRLQELEQERLQMQEERELLSRQQDAMREHAGPRELRLVEAAVVAAPEADLLEETEKLMKEKVEVQRQAEKDNSDLLRRVKLLEAELEEQVNRMIELEQAHTTEAGDLRQQTQALEKQLEKNRKFLDEQAADREHERDVFQQEITKLEQQLKNPHKQQTGSEQRDREVDQLTSQLKEKADWCSELLLGSEQLRREVGERDEEIDKLESRVRELEQALLASTEAEEKRQHVLGGEATDNTLEAQLQTEREALDRKEKEISNLEEQLEQFREELENKSEEVQQLHMQLEIQKKEISSQQQHLDHRQSILQEIDQKDDIISELESQVECLRSEQERLRRNNEEEQDQLNAVIDRLQQELANIEQKQAAEEEEDGKGLLEGDDRTPSTEEFEEMKQKMDLATKELDTLKAEHSKLLGTYQRLKENTVALVETEVFQSSEGELTEALRQKTASLLVMQAQVQALEQSATCKVEELSRRVQELEDLATEKDCELAICRLSVARARDDADELQQKVSSLEDRLRDRVAAALVSQAQLDAVQQQASRDPKTKDPHQEPRKHTEAQAFDFGDLGIPRLDFSNLGRGAARGPTGKVVLLTEKLRELEVGLSGMQKDQELQKQLLSSSEEEVLEYEKRLAVLMDLLNQMKAKSGGHQRTPFTAEPSCAGDETTISELLRELQEVRDDATATKEQLTGYRENSKRLQEELHEKAAMIETLQKQLETVSLRGSEEAKVPELQQKLKEVQDEATTTKEEMLGYKDSCEKLQELLQEREMSIAHLKGKLYQLTSEEEGDSRVPQLLQELQEVRNEASATKEELSSFKERTEKLQVELQVRDQAIAKLKEELQQVRTALAKTAGSTPPSPAPSPAPQPVTSSSSSSSSTAQPKKKGGKQQSGKGGAAKDKPSLSRKNSAAAASAGTAGTAASAASGQSSDKPRTPPQNGDSAQKRISLTHTATQTEPLQMPGHDLRGQAAAKEEVEEVIVEFQEKIVQMQELHAAEILDMEARHISESDTLRRDTQALEDECKALKTVIDKLRSSEVPSSRLDRAASAQLKDGYTSDSSSDYSQRTGYDLHSLQQEFRTTPDGARRETDDALPDRIKTLLREVHQEGMQVLSLSELPVPEGEAGSRILSHGMAKERDALLATVESLKALITQMQTPRDTQTSGGVDWRGELLAAVQEVFVKERSVLKATLYTRLDLLDTSDAVIHLNQLEHSLAELDAQHREVLGSLYSADRSSLLSEVRQLRAQLEQLQTQYPGQGVQAVVPSGAEGGALGQREREAAGVGGGSGGAVEADRLLVEELKGELAQTKLELETTLKAQHKHLKELDALRMEMSQKAAQVDTLTDQLSEEKKKSRELQWAVEKERCQTGRKEERDREELEDLQLSLGEQQARVAQLTSTLEQERQASSQISQQAEQERLGLHRRLQELQVQLETEQAKGQEMRSALGRERELRRGLSSEGGPTSEEGPGEDRRGPQKEGGDRPSEDMLERLQRELDEKEAQVVRLLGEVEEQKLEAVRREEELTLASQRCKRTEEALREARAQLESLESEAADSQVRLDEEVQRRRSIEQEKEQLEERVAQLGELREGQGAGTGPPQVDNQNTGWRGEASDRTKDWLFQQKSSTPTTMDATGQGSTPGRSAERILGKLHLIASKVRSMGSRGTNRLTTEVDTEELHWVQSNIDEVINMLQQYPGTPSAPESLGLPAGGSSSSSSNSLAERLLRQNAELTGFVSRLTEEKNDLRNQSLRLEEELRRYRQAGLGSGDGALISQLGSRTAGHKMDSASLLLSQEREAWGRERVRLEKLLRLAQAEVSRLRGEIRTDALRDITGPEADNASLKRMYGRYLRSESFRKALIYQKKYLLLLLGGFQECEEATLSLICRMGGRPSISSLDAASQRRRGLTRFRSAVRVSIALSRMRFLVKRWQKATGGGSHNTVNRNGLGQSIGTEVRDSPYLHPGSVDTYRERGGGGVGGGGGMEGGSSSRGRTGRDSPRSAISSAHHSRFHMAGDPGPLTCSHLQSYDPDRALTDYISRLEALQRRLGSVTSGSSSYAQLHFGMRR